MQVGCVRAVVLGLGVMSSAAVARADTIAADLTPFVTFGNYLVAPEGDSFAFFGTTLSGESFSIIQTSGPIMTPKVLPGCQRCQPGDIVDLGFRHPPFREDSTNFVDLGSGLVSLPPSFPGSTPALLIGSLKFLTTPMVFPSTDTNSLLIQAPFRFRGWISGMVSESGGFGLRIRGLGSINQEFARDGDAFVRTGESIYQFEAVAPEPSSLLLLATGAAALGRRFMRRRASGG